MWGMAGNAGWLKRASLAAVLQVLAGFVPRGVGVERKRFAWGRKHHCVLESPLLRGSEPL